MDSDIKCWKWIKLEWQKFTKWFFLSLGVNERTYFTDHKLPNQKYWNIQNFLLALSLHFWDEILQWKGIASINCNCTNKLWNIQPMTQNCHSNSKIFEYKNTKITAMDTNANAMEIKNIQLCLFKTRKKGK